MAKIETETKLPEFKPVCIPINCTIYSKLYFPSKYRFEQVLLQILLSLINLFALQL